MQPKGGQQFMQRLPKGGASLFSSPPAPEQPAQGFTQHRSRSRQCQNGEQGPGLAGSRQNASSGGVLRLHRPEHGQTQQRLRRLRRMVTVEREIRQIGDALPRVNREANRELQPEGELVVETLTERNDVTRTDSGASSGSTSPAISARLTPGRRFAHRCWGCACTAYN
jgi:hypothetical protein